MNNLRERLGRTLGTYAWIIADLLRGDRWRGCFVTLLTVVSVSAQAGVVGTVLAFVHQQISGQRQAILGWEPPASATLPVLLVWGGTAMVLALIAAVSGYRAEAMAFTIARQYVRRAIDAVLVAVTSPRLRLPGDAEADELSRVRRLITGDATIVLRSLMVVLHLPRFLLNMLFWLAVMAWLNGPLTAVALLVLVGYLLPLSFVYRGVLRAAHAHEAGVRRSSAAVARLARFLLGRRGPGTERGDWSAGGVIQEEPLAALRGILLARRKVMFIQDIAFGAVLVLVLLVFGVFVAEDRVSWTPLVAYLAALRMAATAMGSTASSLTGLNRYLPPLRRYVAFRRANPPAAGDPGGRPITVKGLTIVPVDPVIEGSLPLIAVGPGDRVLCGDSPLMWVTGLHRFLERLLGEGPSSRRLLAHTFYFHGGALPPPLPLAALASGGRPPAPEQRARVESLLAALGLSEECARLPAGIDTPLTEDVVAAMSEELRYASGVMEGLLGDRPLVILGWAALSRLAEEFKHRLLELLHDRLVIVVAQRLPPRQPASLGWTVIMDADAVRGAGDASWHETVWRVMRENAAPDRCLEDEDAMAADLLDD